MWQRKINFLKNRSFFLFGARNTGKSTLLKQFFTPDHTLWLDLLDPLEEAQFSNNPNQLKALVAALPVSMTHVVIDEIQKVPALLDGVHHLIENTDKKFIMSGSSARKLKYGGANLLAGRAFVYHLYPFSFVELGADFNLNRTLQFGLLPEIYLSQTDQERSLFLQAYAHTYLKEEVWAEQLVRRLNPFRKFLEVAAQCNGKIINIANIARDVGVDDKTIKQYFSILEDTLLGFYLEAFQNSFRKRLSSKPKFYWFDPGVVRALTQLSQVPLQEGTSGYGDDAFEHFIILEFVKLSSYYNREFRLSYLKTKDDAEIDLVVERPGNSLLCVEIKSSSNVQLEDLTSFCQLTKELPNCEAVCLSRDSRVKQYDHVKVMPWQEGVLYCLNL